jgi:hypothetical protein
VITTLNEIMTRQLDNKVERETKYINLVTISFVVFISFNELTNQGIEGA